MINPDYFTDNKLKIGFKPNLESHIFNHKLYFDYLS